MFHQCIVNIKQHRAVSFVIECMKINMIGAVVIFVWKKSLKHIVFS